MRCSSALTWLIYHFFTIQLVYCTTDSLQVKDGKQLHHTLYVARNMSFLVLLQGSFDLLVKSYSIYLLYDHSGWVCMAGFKKQKQKRKTQNKTTTTKNKTKQKTNNKQNKNKNKNKKNSAHTCVSFIWMAWTDWIEFSVEILVIITQFYHLIS